MKHKNMKQYEEKNAPKLNHDITLEEIEPHAAHIKRKMITATWQRSAALLQENKKKKCRHSLQKGRVKSVISCFALAVICGSLKVGLFLAILLSISSNLLSLAGPMYSGYAVDAMVGKGQVNMERVIYCCEIMVALYLVSAALAYILNLVMLQITKRIVSTMRSNIFDRLMASSCQLL